jgi:type IV pilus assembly protein PilN
MNLQINLATRVYVNTSRLRLAIGVISLVLAALLYANIFNLISNFHEIGRLTEKTSHDRRSAPADLVPEKEYQQLMARVQFANDILKKRSFDWLLLLDHFEAVVPDGVVLTAVTPGKEKEIKLSGAAYQFANVRRFLENLESSKGFRDIYLNSQGETQFGTDHKGIVFSITCKATF